MPYAATECGGGADREGANSAHCIDSIIPSSKTLSEGNCDTCWWVRVMLSKADPPLATSCLLPPCAAGAD